jgi:hypothetical protein
MKISRISEGKAAKFAGMGNAQVGRVMNGDET